MTHLRTLVLFGLFLFALSSYVPTTDAATNVCQVGQQYRTLPSRTAVSSCNQNFGTSVYCETQTYTYLAPVCYPTPYGAMCQNEPMTGYYYYYGPGPSVSGAVSQSVAYCPHYPNPTVSVSTDTQNTTYGGYATISWTSTGAASCYSSEFDTHDVTIGSAQVEVRPSGGSSSKTYTVTCTNGVDATDSDSVSVSVSNPSTPPTCTPWDSSKTNNASAINYNPNISGSSNPYSPGHLLQTGSYSERNNQRSGATITPQSCMNACQAYSDSAGKTVSCGTHAATMTYGFGGSSYNGYDGMRTTYYSCTAVDGTTLYPSNNYSYEEVSTAGGNPFNSNDPDYWNLLQQSGCFSLTGTGPTCMLNGYSYYNAGATTCTFTPPEVPAPTATLTANPTSVVQGSSSTLTWSSTNATSCTGTNFSTGGATSGSVSVTPGSTTNYSVTCTGEGGSATANASVAVTLPAITASCSVSPTSITTGQSATWTATAGGGTGSYTYSWTGSDSLTGSAASVSKTYTTTGTKTASVTVSSGGQSATVACSNSLSVTPAVQPADLTAGSVSPTSATAGQAVSLSATASNIGAGPSGSFPLLFQVESPAHLENSSYLPALAVGGSGSRSVSHTFSSAGTYRVRACANYNTSWVAITTESNYGNNCGPWTTINVSSATPPQLSCSVSDSTVDAGQSVTYSASGGSTPYTWTPSDGVGSYGTGSTASRTFSSNGSYGMTVSKSGYTSGNCPVVVVGGGATCGEASVSIQASPDRVREGESTTITWSATGVDGTCTVTENGSTLSTVSGVSCNIPNGSSTRTITRQTVYRISCDNGEGTDEVVVNLVGEYVEF